MRFKLKLFLMFLMAFTLQSAIAQEKLVTGKVTEGGSSLPGVNVVVKGTTRGVQTGFDGSYSIKAREGEFLVFTFLGMKEVTREVGASNQINVSMSSESTQLTEIVVGALGIKRKKDQVTSSQQVVKAKDLLQANNPDAVQSLAGKVSGLQVNTTTTGLTPSTDIVLRGYRSISGGNGALVVIDNVISSSAILSSLDPNLIESVNVIKGANGAALYGQVGGNGVIVVTTKKGTKEEGKFKIDYKSSLTFEKVAFLPERQDRFGQGWEGNLDWTDQGAWGPEFDGSMQLTGTPYPGVNDYRYFKYEHIEDNILPFFETGMLSQNTITLSTGKADGYFTLSANRVVNDGVLPTNKYTKNFFALSAGKKAGKFNLSTNVRFTSDKTNRATNNSYQALSQGATNIPIEAFNSGDNYDHWTLYATSPYWSIRNQRVEQKNNIFDFNAEVQYDLNKNINAIFRNSVRFSDRKQWSYTNLFKDLLVIADTDRTVEARYDTAKRFSNDIYNDLMLNFDYNLTKDISVKALVGGNLTSSLIDRLDMGGNGLLIPGFYDISNITDIPEVDETQTRQRSVALFSNIDLAYRDYLFLNATARNEWTSKLAKNNNSFFYPSVGVSFVPTSAFKSIKGKTLSKMKLSASYVKVGNANAVDPYVLNERAVQAPGYSFGNLNSFIASVRGADANLKPETVTSNELNANFEFLNVGVPRITLDATATFAKNKDQILEISPSRASGLQNVFVNVGQTSSKSYEVDLGLVPLRTDNFQWDLNLGYATYKTVVDRVSRQATQIETRFVDNNGDGIRDGGTTVGIAAIEGQEFPLIRGTAYTRDPQGRIVLDAQGNPIRSGELKVLGKVTPDYVLNFRTGLRYKSVRLNAVMDYRTGHKFYSGTANNLTAIGGTIETAQNGRKPFLYPNSSIQTAPGVYTENTSVLTGGTSAAAFQRYITQNYESIDENFVLDATALKLREVSLTYDFSKKLLENTSIDALSLGVSGRNLFMLLPKANRGYNDPEIGTGLEFFSQTPPTRMYTFSLNVTF